ncbi:MAG TPA: DUF4126 domain-containing protein [Burkholderiaceae bacterium]|nr:DUF4126 domain-containing protein [Burkholderiaceae bacterium]
MNSFDLPQLLALAAVLGFASGLRLYAVLLIVGLVGVAGWVQLPPGLQVLAHPAVLAVAGVMFLAEFFADKIPALDTLWDAVHTFIRIPAGAALAAGALGADHATWAVIAALVGGTLAATSHFTKAGARAAVNASPEPVSNIVVSTSEDVLVGGLLWLVLKFPLVAAAIVLLFVLFAAWLLPKLFRFVRRVFLRRSEASSTSTG